MAGFPTEGRADPDEGVLVVDGDRLPLEAVRSHRTFLLGRFALCWVSYERGVPRAPRTLVVSRGSLDRVRSLLDEGIGEDSDAPTLEPVQRWILISFGVGCLAVGPALWALLSGDGVAVALYAGALFGVFGLLFLWYAATG